jgi:hypothetical protein
MRRALFCAMSFAALLGASATVHEAKAAPVIAAAPPGLPGPTGGPIQPVYYYHGRYYPYHYGGGYYHHRYYRHGHWHYY